MSEINYGENSEEAVLYSSAVRTLDSISPEVKNLGGFRGCRVVIDMTAVPTVETVTFTIQGKDKASGKWYTLLASIAVVATGVVVLTVYPGLTAVANVTATDVIPDRIRVDLNHSASGNFTYSLGIALIK